MTTLYDLLNKYEGAGNLSTLFGHSQKQGGRFAGTDVSKMTLGALKDFASPSGEYGQWVKDQVGRVATPMGVGQIVGTTLRNTQKQLGLSDDTVYDEATQRRMIDHLAKNRIDPASRERTLAGLRNEWEGFKHVDDDTLWTAATSYTGDTTLIGGEGKDNLTGFQKDMQKGSSVTAKILEKFLDPLPEEVKGKQPPAKAGVLPSQAAAAATHPALKSLPPNINQLAQEHANRAAISPAAAAAQPRVSTTGPSDQAPTPNQVLAELKKEGGPEQADLIDKIGEAIFPKADNPREKFGQMLSSAGIGLGQMSAGQPVNLQPYFNNIQESRSIAQAAAQKMEQQQFENDIKLGQLEVSQGNLAVAQQNAATTAERLGFDATKAEAGTVSPFTEEQLDAFSKSPDTKGLVDMLASPNEEAQKQGLMGLKNVMENRATKLVGDKPKLGNFYEAVANNAPPEKLAQIISDDNIGANDINAVYGALGKSPTTLMKNTEAYNQMLEEDPLKAKQLEALLRNTAGQDETKRETANREYYENKQDALAENLSTIGQVNAELQTLEDGTLEEIIAGGKSTGPFRETLRLGYEALRQTFGADEAQAFEDAAGISIDAMAKVDQSTAMLGLLIAKPLMKGQGTVTDSERRELLKALVSVEQTPESRLAAIEKLRMLNEIDAAAAATYRRDGRDRETDDYSNARDAWADTQTAAADVKPALTNAAARAAPYKHYSKVPAFQKQVEAKLAQVKAGTVSFEDIVAPIAPILSPADHALWGEAAPNINGYQFWQRREAGSGDIVLMNGNQKATDEMMAQFFLDMRKTGEEQ